MCGVLDQDMIDTLIEDIISGKLKEFLENETSVNYNYRIEKNIIIKDCHFTLDCNDIYNNSEKYAQYLKICCDNDKKYDIFFLVMQNISFNDKISKFVFKSKDLLQFHLIDTTDLLTQKEILDYLHNATRILSNSMIYVHNNSIIFKLTLKKVKDEFDDLELAMENKTQFLYGRNNVFEFTVNDVINKENEFLSYFDLACMSEPKADDYIKLINFVTNKDKIIKFQYIVKGFNNIMVVFSDDPETRLEAIKFFQQPWFGYYYPKIEVNENSVAGHCVFRLKDLS